MRHVTLRARKLAAAVVLPVVAGTLVAAAVPSQAATPSEGSTVTPSHFGINPGVRNFEKLPKDSFGAMRLWDTDTAWCNLQPRPALITRATLDARIGPYIRKAKRDGYRTISVVLGHPPNWVFQTQAENRTIPGAWVNESPPEGVSVKGGTPAPGGSFVCKGKYGGSQLPVFKEGGPNHSNFLMYATAVMSYVKSELAGTNIQRQFEVWNELGERNSLNPRQGGFGNIATDEDSADRAARSLLDYTAVVKQLSRPTPATRSTSGGRVLSAALFEPTAHITRAYLRNLNANPTIVDAMNVHGYFEKAKSEMIANIRQYRQLARKPLYVTEINEAPGPALSNTSESALTARTIANGFYYRVAGQYWYGWMRSDLEMIPLAPGSPAVNTLAAMRRMLVGLTLPSCGNHTTEIRKCTFINPKNNKLRISLLWTADAATSVRYTAESSAKFNSVTTGERISRPTHITSKPVLVTTTHPAIGGLAGAAV